MPKYSRVAGKDSSRFHPQMVKGGTQVRGANETNPTAYPMCVLCAVVVIILAAAFLL